MNSCKYGYELLHKLKRRMDLAIFMILSTFDFGASVYSAELDETNYFQVPITQEMSLTNNNALFKLTRDQMRTIKGGFWCYL